MRKKIFDYKFYLQGLTQLRLIGIIFYVICVVSSALQPIMAWIGKARIATMNINPALSSGVSSSGVSYSTISSSAMIQSTTSYPIISSSNIVLMIFIYLAPVIMCISLFSFINKSNASDFYHSAPNTRTSIFLSFGASILSWLYITIISTVGISSLLYVCAGSPFNFINFCYMIFTYLAAVTLVTGGILLAMSITGTILTNIVVSALILVVPRLILTVYTNTLSSTLIIANINDFGLFVNPNINIPFSLISIFFPIGSFRSYNYLNSSFFIPGIIYTFVLGFVYLGLGVLFYKSRKSEAAGKSAPNRILQHIFRLAITLPVSLIIPCSIVGWKGTGAWLDSNLSTLITVVAVCLLIYFMYELITTKKAKNLIKAAPLFLIIIVIDIVFGVALVQTREAVYAFKPTAGDIEYVSFGNNQNQQMYYMNNNVQSYNNLQLKNIKYNNKDMIYLISSTLSDTIDMVKTNSLYSNNGVQMFSQYVTIKTKDGKTTDRMVYMMQSNYELITNLEKDNAEFTKAFFALPSDNDVKSISIGNVSTVDCKKIWETFKEEYKNLSLDDAMGISGVNYNYQKINYASSNTRNLVSNGNINVTGDNGTDNFVSNYMITSATPNTIKLLDDLQNSEFKKKAIDAINKLLANENLRFRYTITGSVRFNEYDEKVNISKDNLNNTNNYLTENDKAILEIVKNQPNNKVDISQNYVVFSIMLPSSNPISNNFNMTLDKDTYSKILALSLNYQ
jgi:ABC-2 type transport system permease protein